MQYILILSRALFRETDVRNAWTHVDWGVAGEHPTEGMWGRRQRSRWRIREEGLDVIVKRALEEWVEDVWVEVFVEAEAEGGAVADRSHGQYKVGCGVESRAQKAEAAGGDAELRD